jgi:hypothetical protein
MPVGRTLTSGNLTNPIARNPFPALTKRPVLICPVGTGTGMVRSYWGIPFLFPYIGAGTTRNSRSPNSNYQPAGNASALAAGRNAVHGEGGTRFAILRFALTGSGVTETSCTGAFSRAKASCGGLVTAASAMTGEFCGTMVGTRVENYWLWPLTI